MDMIRTKYINDVNIKQHFVLYAIMAQLHSNKDDIQILHNNQPYLSFTIYLQ